MKKAAQTPLFLFVIVNFGIILSAFFDSLELLSQFLFQALLDINTFGMAEELQIIQRGYLGEFLEHQRDFLGRFQHRL